MENKQNLEKIKDKLIKIKSLSEGGYKGEAIAAKNALEKLLAKHGLTMESLTAENKKLYWIKAENEYSERILIQCYYHVLDVRKCAYKKLKHELGFELTAFEYAELINAYIWHCNQFKKELEEMEKNLLTAYVNKHRIFSSTREDDENIGSDKEMDLEQLHKILTLMENLENVSYHKQLNEICQ